MIPKKSTVFTLLAVAVLALAGSKALPSTGNLSTGSVTVTLGETQFFAGSYHTVLNISNVDSPQAVEVLVLSPIGEQIFSYNTGDSGWVAYLNGTLLTYEAYDGNHIHYGIPKGTSMAVLTVLTLSTGFPVEWSAYTKQGNDANERYILLDQGTVNM